MPLFGVDISRWNVVDWPWLRGRVGFVGFRVTWGVRGVDPAWRSHLAGALSIGALPIAYHVADPWLAASAQVEHFLATLGKDAGSAWMLDVEPTKGQRPATFQQWADVTAGFAYDLSPRVGAPPQLYGSPNFLGALPLPSDLDGAPLWLAAWRNGPEDEARRPALAVRPWRHVTIWQVGTRPQADGSPLDWDRFEGTREELEAALCTRLTHAIDG